MKIILVPLSTAEGGEDLLDAAFAVAGRFKSHVEGLHVKPDPADAIHLAGMAFPGALKESVLEAGARHTEEAASQVRALFEGYCQKHQIKILEHPPLGDSLSAAWHEATGKESLVVALRGRLSDLTVVRRPVEQTPAPVTLEAALLQTGKPVLILPPKKATAIGHKVAIAWNGSRAAAKAVAAARHFLIGAESVTILSLPEDKGGRLTVADLVEHLAWHDVTADAKTFEPRSGSIGEALLREAGALGCDLLVLGGYGTSMTREMLLGGVTRHMLAHAELPLFMTH